MSLMQRLAQVGLGRRDDEAQAPQAAHTAPPVPQYGRRCARAPASRKAVRRAGVGIRPPRRRRRVSIRTAARLPVHNSREEDQLDIPAFLRRQAN